MSSVKLKCEDFLCLLAPSNVGGRFKIHLLFYFGILVSSKTIKEILLTYLPQKKAYFDYRKHSINL